MASLSETPLRDLPPTRPLTLGLWTTAAAAARTLLEAQASEGLVLDGGRPLGVITSRGLSRLLARHAEQTTHLAVRDIMDPVAVAPDAELLPAALRHVLAAPSRRLAVVDVKGMTVGVLAPSHVARAYGGGDELAGRTVAEAMTRTVVTARSEEMATTVLGRMARATVGSVVVVDAADKPQGLFTARDAMELLARERPLRNLRLGECMRAPVVAVSPQMGLDAALGGMDGQGGGRLAVTAAAGFLLGLLTWTDIVKVLVEACAEVEDVRHREEAAFYRDLYDNAPQGLFRMDLDGRLLTANATLARLVGFDSADTFLNRGRQIVHPLRLDLPERRELLIRALSSPQAVSFESRVFHQDGTSSRISCIVRAVRDEVGAPTHLEGACADAEGGDAPGAGLLNEESYRSIVEHQTELICRYSPEGRLILANAAFARYWGTTPEDCVAKNFQPDVPEEDRIRVANRLGALTRERPTTGFEFRVLRPDGRLRWQRWTCRAIFDAAGRLLEYQAVGRDITGRKRAEERLRAQCLFAQTLLEAMPAPVYYKDANGRFQGCNKAFESLLGMPREQVIGHDDYAVLPAEQAAVHIGKDRELIHRGGRQFYETSLETAIGQRHVLLRNSLFRDGDGNVAGIIGIALDITERKQAEVAATRIRSDLEAGLARHAEELREANSRLTAEVAERQRIEVELRRSTLFLESVLNAIQDGICVLGPDMTVLKANKAMRMLYAKHGEPEGQKCHAAFRSQPSPSAKCPFHHTLSTGKLAICSVPKLDGDEAVGWLEIYSYPLFAEDGAVSGVTEIVRDVTARKKLESELAAALELAEAGSQAKGAFLANMSHEIRTPLNAVLGYVQLMLHDSLESRQRERLTVVEESAATLLSIINDILDYSKIEAGRMEIKAEPFDLMRCLEAVIREQEVLARDKGLELTLDCDPGLPRVVRGDGLRLRQILRNLVNNAVKYTEKGGVTVTAALETVGQPEATGTPGHAALLRDRYRAGHPRGPAGHHFRQLHPGGRQPDPATVRHRSGPGHLPASGRPDGRFPVPGKPARRGERFLPPVPLRGSALRHPGQSAGRRGGGRRHLAAAPHPFGRGQPGQPDVRRGSAGQPGAYRGHGRRRPGCPGLFGHQSGRCGAHGHPDAGHGRPDRHPGHPGRGAGHRSGAAGDRPVRLRHGPGTGALSGRRPGRLHHQAHRRAGLFRHRASGPGQTRPDRGEPEADTAGRGVGGTRCGRTAPGP